MSERAMVRLMIAGAIGLAILMAVGGILSVTIFR